MAEQDEFYVGISNPNEIRREILETSREIVLILQNFEKFKLSRIKKLDHIEKLRRNIKEINDLVLRLKKALPVAKIRIKPLEEKKVVKKIYRGKSPEIENLEKELSAIESKLSAIK